MQKEMHDKYHLDIRIRYYPFLKAFPVGCFIKESTLLTDFSFTWRYYEALSIVMLEIMIRKACLPRCNRDCDERHESAGP